MSEIDFLRGVYCPLIVPFRNGKIDFDTYGKLIERQIAEGTHGLLVNATSGEPTSSWICACALRGMSRGSPVQCWPS